jgi:hypothetical protein
MWMYPPLCLPWMNPLVYLMPLACTWSMCLTPPLCLPLMGGCWGWGWC